MGNFPTDYFMGLDHRLYQNLLFWDMQHNWDHYLILGCLQGVMVWEHMCYFGSMRRFLSCWIKASLQGDCQHKAVEVGDSAEVLVQPKIYLTLLLSGMYRKLFIYCRNKTNSQ